VLRTVRAMKSSSITPSAYHRAHAATLHSCNAARIQPNLGAVVEPDLRGDFVHIPAFHAVACRLDVRKSARHKTVHEIKIVNHQIEHDAHIDAPPRPTAHAPALH